MVDNRRHIAAVRPCGCWVSILTLSDPDHGYAATPNDVGRFHRDVYKARTRKENPLDLKVVEFDGQPMSARCEACHPSPAQEPTNAP